MKPHCRKSEPHSLPAARPALGLSKRPREVELSYAWRLLKSAIAQQVSHGRPRTVVGIVMNRRAAPVGPSPQADLELISGSEPLLMSSAVYV